MEDSGIDSDPKNNTRMEDDIVFTGSDSSCSSNNQTICQRSTTKQLQKKLEARIEQAKRIQRNSEYIKLPDNEPDNFTTKYNNQLIPIHRLPIPQKKVSTTLIEFCHSDDSEDEMTLFPMTRENGFKHKQDLTDTFSIEELSEGSEDSLHLGAVPEIHPNIRTYMPRGFCCCQCLII